MVVVSILLWVVVAIVKLMLVIFGYVLIPLAGLFNAHQITVSPYYNNTVRLFTWKIMAPYQNYEDGIDAGLELPNSPTWVRIIYWSAWRNPVSGIRWAPLISTQIKPDKIKFKIKTDKGIVTEKSNIDKHSLDILEEGKDNPNFSYFISQGFYSNYRIERLIYGKRFRFWIGNFKGYPSQSKGVSETDYQRYGSGPVYQLKEVK